MNTTVNLPTGRRLAAANIRRYVYVVDYEPKGDGAASARLLAHDSDPDRLVTRALRRNVGQWTIDGRDSLVRRFVLDAVTGEQVAPVPSTP